MPYLNFLAAFVAGVSVFVATQVILTTGGW